MKKVSDLRIMMKCCSMYYEDNLNQREIANQLGLSRPTVSRILKEAYDLGVVKIQIKNILENDYQQVERALEKKYDLKEAIVVDDKQDSLSQKQELARGVSEYLSRIIKDKDIVGVSIGTTIKQIPMYMERGIYKNVTFVPLLGAIGDNELEIHANNIAVNMARSYGGKFKLLHAPAVISQLSTKESLYEDDKIREAIELIDKVTIALLGIGDPMSLDSTIRESGYMKEEDIQSLEKNNIVGVMCLQGFDGDGNTSILDFNKRVLGIDLDKLKKINRSIGIACGEEKITAIKAALKGKLINSLAINYTLALKLLD